NDRTPNGLTGSMCHRPGWPSQQRRPDIGKGSIAIITMCSRVLLKRWPFRNDSVEGIGGAVVCRRGPLSPQNLPGVAVGIGLTRRVFFISRAGYGEPARDIGHGEK